MTFATNSHSSVKQQCFLCQGWFMSRFEEERLYCDNCATSAGWAQVELLRSVYYKLGPVPPEGVGR